MKHWTKKTLWLAGMTVLAGGGFQAWNFTHTDGNGVFYQTAPIDTGSLVSTISASGTLEPEEAIDVGTQVVGQISRFGTEGGKPDGKLIDRRSFVKKGDLLAQIDPSLYKLDLESAQAQLAQSNAQMAQSQAQLAQSDAQLAQSEANIRKAEADIRQMEAKKDEAEQDWNRVQQAMKTNPNAISETSYGSYKAIYLTGIANLASAQAVKTQVEAAKVQAQAVKVQAVAAIKQNEAAIKQAQVLVARAQQNLDYCTITSPVDGVVIDRRVNIGQTVVSSLNTPSLFLIAKDLSRMQIWASVNEADIGSIHEGQLVTFAVDARPGVTFKGQVTKVRFDATMTQNVVTYPVEVLALNPDGLLYPYMTANVQFEVSRRTDVLRVPNAAIRYMPLAENLVAPEFRAQFEKLAQHTSAPDASHSAGHVQDQGTLWIERGKWLEPITVRLGLSDGAMTEVASPELKAGLAVVTSEEHRSSVQTGASPFMPHLRRG